MSESDAFHRELFELEVMPSGPAKVAALADLARRTEATGDPGRLRRVRWALLIAAAGTELGDDRVLPTFAALLADFDADPDAAAADGSPPDRVLTAYAEVLRYTTRYPSIPRERVESLLDDFARRVDALGGDEADMYETRLHARGTLGDLEAVPAMCVAMIRARERAGLPRSWDAEALAGIYTAQPERSLAAMRPVIANQIPGAWMWRSSFLEWSLRPLIWAGEEEEADRNFAEADARSGSWLFGDILLAEYASRRLARQPERMGEEDVERLRTRVRRLLKAAPQMGPSFRGQAYQACGFACEALAAQHDEPLRLLLPGEDDSTSPPLRSPSDVVAPLLAEADLLDEAFAARNGNEYLAVETAGNRAFVFGPGSGIDRVPAPRRERLRALWEAAESSADPLADASDQVPGDDNGDDYSDEPGDRGPRT
ncbi:hypothetical protein [Alienimonas chondri]|uniref:Uncharacterized protein n=1 Tax=Alienimonas chondri TaxID=2681879 RepID=A0ABX1VBN7_9PLAN|nr:hypothetical protein [Alienimonas chondri]NNJ25297.1 hypothetical protein [Alienimonas chondri]